MLNSRSSAASWGFRKLVFPFVLAVVWVVLCAAVMVDFASFDHTMQVQKQAAQAVAAQGGRAALPQGRSFRLSRR